MKARTLTTVLSILTLSLAACQSLSTPEPTATPEPTTTTAPTETPKPTNTPEPTATNTPEPTATPTPNATATAQAYATATVQAVISDIDKSLQKFELSADTGRLGFLHDPVTVKVNTYGEEKHESDFPETTFKDFVLQTDVTWNSKTGIAGCYIIFRSEPDNIDGKQYRFFMMRLLNNPLWDFEYYHLNRFQRSVSQGIQETGALLSSQDSTNTITLIVQGSKIAAYANGERLGIFNDSKLTEGSLAFGVFQESGETTCTFENIWVWSLDEE